MLQDELQNIIQPHKERRKRRKWLQALHHQLMKEYGWIPFEEFKQLPLPMLMNLIEEINEQRTAEQKEIDKSKNRSRVRR